MSVAYRVIDTPDDSDVLLVAVVQGSRGRTENVASILGTPNERLREQLANDRVSWLHKAVCSSLPVTIFSQAPARPPWRSWERSANGWVVWKTPRQKLDEMKRQPVNVADPRLQLFI